MVDNCRNEMESMPWPEGHSVEGVTSLTDARSHSQQISDLEEQHSISESPLRPGRGVFTFFRCFELFGRSVELFKMQW